MSETVTATGLDAKREEAKAQLGPQWVLHPNYQFNPRHSSNPSTYQPARAEFLSAIAARANADRRRNPNYVRRLIGN